MTVYVNAGAYVAGARPRTKKALREALATAPGSVIFDTTAAFNPFAHYRATEIPAGVTLSVVGPDPYAKRSWYASVTFRDGRLVIS